MTRVAAGTEDGVPAWGWVLVVHLGSAFLTPGAGVPVRGDRGSFSIHRIVGDGVGAVTSVTDRFGSGSSGGGVFGGAGTEPTGVGMYDG